MKGTLLEDQYTFSIISRSVLPRIKNIWNKSCREYRNTHVMFNNFFFLKSCRLWINVEKYCRADRAQMIIWRMCFACWVPNATSTHTVCVILIDFPLQQWLHESAKCYIIRTLPVLLVSILYAFRDVFNENFESSSVISNEYPQCVWT